VDDKEVATRGESILNRDLATLFEGEHGHYLLSSRSHGPAATSSVTSRSVRPTPVKSTILMVDLLCGGLEPGLKF
jgi:hypothetical protein